MDLHFLPKYGMSHKKGLGLNYKPSISEENLTQRPAIEEMKQSVEEKVLESSLIF